MTTDLREAIVVVEVEGSSRAHWAVGRLELLQHHTWQDLEVLCDDVLIQYSHFLQGRQGVALRHSRTPPVLLSVPPTNGKVSERLLELLQVSERERERGRGRAREGEGELERERESARERKRKRERRGEREREREESLNIT